MTALENTIWSRTLSNIDFAFQPIVNVHTGVCYGYEALLRNYRTPDFKSVNDFFERAYRDKVLHQVDLAMRKKAVRKFSGIMKQDRLKLFFNMNKRTLDIKDNQAKAASALMRQYNLSPDMVCFEISERNDLMKPEEMAAVLKGYQSRGFKIAMDGYGIGMSDFQMLYHIEPDFIKIDRFFIREIEKDSKKRLFVSNIVDVAHYLGSIVVAVGVETRETYQVCRNIGCDMIQGHLVQRPEVKWKWLRSQYRHIHLLDQSGHQSKGSEDGGLIRPEIEDIEPVAQDADIFEVFKQFRQKEDHTFFPVVTPGGEPLGIVREKSFKEYVYSRYGNELLQNPSFGRSVNKFITKFPVADIHTPPEKILELYSQNDKIEGILVTDKMKYAGFLSASSLLRILNEKNVIAARDQNPLSKLPGSTLVYEYVSKALQDTRTPYVFAYFDFDNFKAYNDKYGFRQGDRMIGLFSELLKKLVISSDHFAGHIGGDDFFLGIRGACHKDVCSEVSQLLKQFRRDLESFYDAVSVKRGYIISWESEGKMKMVPLLEASAVVVEILGPRVRTCSVRELSRFAEQLMTEVKNGPDNICQTSISGLGKNSPARALGKDIPGKNGFALAEAS